ncbi:TetR/AcrR family transcriptional regulator [Nocardia asteroides]|uniref:TetR/AcrR family transcriptional regulator n=1 Tax=Nocardia asteroides TaxID=1824 RepID=UPI00343E5C25
MPSLTRVPRSARTPPENRRAEFERRVLRAVEELLSEGTPFTELAVQRIAAASGSARSTFYRYFPDKSSLLIRLGELATAELFAAAERWWSVERTDRQAGVVQAAAAMIEGVRAHRFLLVALSEVAAYDREVGAYWRARVAAFTEVVTARLAAERAAGSVASQLDPRSTAVILTAMVERTTAYAVAGETGIDDADLAEGLGRAIWLVVYGDAP